MSKAFFRSRKRLTVERLILNSDVDHREYVIDRRWIISGKIQVYMNNPQSNPEPYDETINVI